MSYVWTDGSSARKLDWHNTPIYHPTPHDRRNERNATVEYITPPDLQVTHPVKKAAQTTVNTAAYYLLKLCVSIPTKVLHDINCGFVLANKWINTGIGAILALCCTLEWVHLLFGTMDAATRAASVWPAGYSVAITCTILILLYRYNEILDRRFDRVEVLHKRKNIIKSLKKTLFMLGRTLLCLYCIIIPHFAKICLAFFTS